MNRNLRNIVWRETILIVQGILAEFVALGQSVLYLLRKKLLAFRADAPAMKRLVRRALLRELAAIQREIVRSLRNK